MTYTEQAIYKAIEGGWEAETWKQLRTRMVNPKEDIKVHVENFEGKMFAYIGAGNWNCADIFLDLLFWQSLGKSLGWENGCSGCGVMKGMITTPECMRTNRVSHDRDEEGWKIKWHRFIDHLAEGKDAESFFESLINVKE